MSQGLGQETGDRSRRNEMLMFTLRKFAVNIILDIVFSLHCRHRLKMFTNTWSRVEIKNKDWMGNLDSILNLLQITIMTAINPDKLPK